MSKIRAKLFINNSGANDCQKKHFLARKICSINKDEMFESFEEGREVMQGRCIIEWTDFFFQKVKKRGHNCC